MSWYIQFFVFHFRVCFLLRFHLFVFISYFCVSASASLIVPSLFKDVLSILQRYSLIFESQCSTLHLLSYPSPVLIVDHIWCIIESHTTYVQISCDTCYFIHSIFWVFSVIAIINPWRICIYVHNVCATHRTSSHALRAAHDCFAI